jgi:hypothetical protein
MHSSTWTANRARQIVVCGDEGLGRQTMIYQGLIEGQGACQVDRIIATQLLTARELNRTVDHHRPNCYESIALTCIA